MTTRRCIYCLEDKPEAAFNREHVIPQAFGKFEDNFTLGCVCEGCNNFFDRHLDRKMARDALEGFYRFKLGLKPPSEFKSMGKASTTRVEIMQDGRMQGVICKTVVTPNGEQLGIDPLPQVGFARTPDGPFKFYLLDSLPPKDELAGSGFEKGDNVYIQVWGTPLEIAEASLEEAGYGSGQYAGETPPLDRVYVESVFQLSHPEFREVTKIAFNYVAFVMGCGSVLLAQFNDARSYIMTGREPGFRVVNFGNSLPVHRRSTGQRVTCHYLSARREGHKILAQVSLYSMIRYEITVSVGPFLVDFPLSSAHLFDVETRRISPAPVGAIG